MILRRSRNIRNSAWNLVNTVLYPLAYLALTPFFIDALGEHRFGTWMVLNSVVFITVQLMHFGMGNSIAVYVAEARGKESDSRLRRYYNSALNFTSVLAASTTVIAFLIWLVAPESWFRWDGIDDPIELKTAFSLTFLVISAKFFEQLMMGFFKGFEEYDTAAKFSMSQKLTMLGGQAAAVYYGYGLAAVILMSMVTNAMMAAGQMALSRRYLADYVWTPAFDAVIFKRLQHFGFWTWLQTIIAMLSFQLDRLVVAFALGTNVVAYYSLASMIANHLQIMLEATVGWIFPAVSRLTNANEDPKPLYFSVRAFLMTIALSGLLILFFIREPLFTLWLGPEKFQSVIPFIELFLLFEVFYVLSIGPKFYLNGISELKLITSIEVGYKSFAIVMMLALFYVNRQATSLIWGQVFAMMVTMPIVLGLVNLRVLKNGFWQESVANILPSTLVALTMVAPEIWMQVLLALTAFASLYFIYLRPNSFNPRLLLE